MTPEACFDKFCNVLSKAIRINGNHTFTSVCVEGGKFCLKSLMYVENGEEVWVNDAQMSSHQRIEARLLMEQLEVAFTDFLASYAAIWPNVRELLPYCHLGIVWRENESAFRLRVGGSELHHCELSRVNFLYVTERTMRGLARFAKPGDVKAWSVYLSDGVYLVPAVDEVDALVRFSVFRGFTGYAAHANDIIDHNAVVVPASFQSKTREAAVAWLEENSYESPA